MSIDELTRDRLLEIEDLRESLLSERRGVAAWCPHEPYEKQSAFLDCPSLEALYGGQAGGGKSDALLMGALQYVDVPGYNAVIFRRTVPDLLKPEAILTRALEWLAPHVNARRIHWNSEQKIFTWKHSGATLSFSHMDTERDRYNHQGSAYQYIGWDELTQFPEHWYLYLFSRLRKPESLKVPLRVRAASNPGGAGHDWVKRRFVDGGIGREECPFFPAGLDDNPYIDKESYRKSLFRLDSNTRRQLEDGVWTRDTGGLVYPFDDADIIEAAPALTDYLLAIDYGFTDSTAFTVIGWRDHDPNVYICESYKTEKTTPSSAAQEAHDLNERYKFQKMIGDIGGLGKGYVEEARRRFQLPIEAAEKTNKRGYISLFVGEMERHRVKIVRPMCQPLLAEFRELSWSDDRSKEAPNAPNHCADSALYGWRAASAFYNREPEAPITPAQRLRDEEMELKRQAIESVKNSDDELFGLL